MKNRAIIDIVQGVEMKRASIVALLLISTLSFLGAADFNWGIKYGLGFTGIYGADSDYELRYNIREHAATVSDYGYIKVSSSDNKMDLSQSAGLYANLRLFSKTSSIRLGTEVTWDRLVYKQQFRDKVPTTSGLGLSTVFNDKLEGHIAGTIDYFTVPLLISFNQELSEELKQEQYQGAFLYIGPSFSYLYEQTQSKSRGIDAFSQKVDDYVSNVLSNPDPTVTYSYSRQETGSDKFKEFKTDLVMGAGFALKDLFGFGLGKDEFVFDLRYKVSLDDLGDSGLRDAVGLRSIMLYIGCRL